MMTEEGHAQRQEITSQQQNVFSLHQRHDPSAQTSLTAGICKKLPEI